MNRLFRAAALAGLSCFCLPAVAGPRVHGFGPPQAMGVVSIADAFVAEEEMTGDGTDDLVIIPRSGPVVGQVFVVRCTGSRIAAPEAWAAFRFILEDEVPAVGDFNGDGRPHVAAVAQPGTVWIAPSTGTGLGSSTPHGRPGSPRPAR